MLPDEPVRDIWSRQWDAFARALSSARAEAQRHALPRALGSEEISLRVDSGLSVQPRHLARVALLIALTVVGFIVARALAERDARRDSDRRAEVAAVQIHGRVAQAASVTEALRRLMLDARSSGVTSDRFARDALRWLGPARFPAAAWVERVPDSRRAAYERRTGQAIVTADPRYGVAPLGSRSSYLPATLATGFPPMAVPAIDLSGAPGLAAALSRATRLNGVVATPIASSSTGPRGLFLVAPAPNRTGAVLRLGYVAVFVPASGLREAATGVPAVRIATGRGSSQAAIRGDPSIKSFTAAGQRFTVAVPAEPVQGPGAVLPWVILAGGLLVAALGGALGLNAARRARAQDELDRIFNLSQDLIAVADFEGRFTRVNPAAEEILGYTEHELLARPYLDLVHPADRDSTAAEADVISRGSPTTSFENRYVRKDGTVRVLDWTTTPDVDNGLMYAVARDVTDRRSAEAEVERLADEQAALRRVATLVARGASQTELFAEIAHECARLFGTEDIAMVRYESDGHRLVMASSGTFKAVFPAGSRQPLSGGDAASLVFETGRSARIDDDAGASGPIGLHSAVATPITVEGRLWGAMITGTSGQEPLPVETESRLGQFTELMATAIANSESRARADRLTEEQAALRRVATLVAKEAPLQGVFAAVVEELARVLGDAECVLFRDEGDGAGSPVAGTPGARLTEDGDGVIASVLREGGPCRTGDSSAGAAVVGCPVIVRGRVWGAMGAASCGAEPLSAGAEARIGQFADLVATAVANADDRAEVARLAQEQAALRRVATLVAEGAPPPAVFDAVATEIVDLLGADGATLCRYESGEEITIVAQRGRNPELIPPGTRTSDTGESVTALVRRSQRPARIEKHGAATGAAAAVRGRSAVRASVAAPVVVNGRLWGAAIANWEGEKAPSAASEERMAQFAGLLDTAIANADSRDQLTASRARLLSAGDDARRRVVRDLHDGAQQRLVHAIIALKLARQALAEGGGSAESLVGEALEQTEQGNAELRDLAHGILPPVLSRGGLRRAIDAMVGRLDLPVDADVTSERFGEEIEASAYFFVAEALTNVVKHAHAGRAEVTASAEDGVLYVTVRDDGIGGADPVGHGLVGVADRLIALGGRFEIDSPAGGGTRLAASLPLSRG
jgi:PAS domain S-box-containing protein